MNSNKKTNRITDISQRKAARMVGFGLVIIFILAPFAEFVVLSNLIVPGDAPATIKNIMANKLLFRSGMGSYIIIIMLDAVVALGLYVVLKPVNKSLSLISAVLRLIYTAIMGISLIALMLLYPNEFSYGQLISYIFFIAHIFIFGYLVFKSGYIPKILGILLMISSFCYIILLYGKFFLPKEWMEILFMIVFVPPFISEISLGVWLLFKAAKLPSKGAKNA